MAIFTESQPIIAPTVGDNKSYANTRGDLKVAGLNLTKQAIQSDNFDSGNSGWRLTAGGELEANTGIFRGTISATALDIPNDTSANSMHVDSDGNTWWGANDSDFAVSNDTALAYVLKTGVAKFQSVTLANNVAISGIANDSNTDIQLLEMSHNLTFAVTDANTINWTSGTINLSNGRTFTMDSGNTGNMSALTYLYLDPGAVGGDTVLQQTTTYSTAVGAGKRLVGTAQNQTTTASFIPYGPGEPLIDGDNIGALSIVAGQIAANAITATKINVSNLSAINADMGTLNAGTITLDTSGFIQGGQTNYKTGTGFWLGNDSGTFRFSIGDSGIKNMTWDGTNLRLGEYSVTETAGPYGDGNDSAIDVNSGSFTTSDTTLIVSNVLKRDAYFTNLTLSGGNLKTDGYRIFCSGTLQINSSREIEWKGNAGSTGAAGGNGSVGAGGGSGAGGSKGTGLTSTNMHGGIAGKDGDGSATGLLSPGDNTGGVGQNGDNSSASIGSAGSVGTGGGGGGEGAGGAGSSGVDTIASTATASTVGVRSISQMVSMHEIKGTSLNYIQGHAGSGSGGEGGPGDGDNTNGGGAGGGGSGSGSGGGTIAIFSKTLVNNGDIDVGGGAGANGANGGNGHTTLNTGGGGGAAGGTGGSGGVIILVYDTKSGSGGTTVTGGAGGTGGTGGTGAGTGGSGATGDTGNTGNSGIVIEPNA